MKKIILFSLALFQSSLQIHSGNPPLEQMQNADSSLEPSKLVGITKSFEVNPSRKKPKYDRSSMATKSLNLEQESTNHMILDTPEFHALITPEVKLLASTFKKYDLEIRIVGGAVRDLLGGKKPHDLDLATVATLTEVKQMFQKEGIRMVNSRGEEKHGTITAHINKINFEISTFHSDLSTDEGHAIEEFSKDWKIDASRRDLTVNAMYLDFQGTLYDYFNGQEDLKARRVVFIGKPDVCLKEDSSRILRYFRHDYKVNSLQRCREETSTTSPSSSAF